jgi:sigma-B regulation protein RsbU (phosphoserine phosphatase)
MKLLTFLTPPAVATRTPAPLIMPAMNSVRVDVQVHPHGGGDFFDALAIGCEHLVFLPMDVAGQRNSALNLAAFVQDEFRSRAPQLFSNERDPAAALSELCLHLNRTILETAGRANLAAALVGILNGKDGTLSYVNAGHVPGLLLAADSTEFLESTGLPLGLFSHATHEAYFRVIPRGGALLMASRGVVEARGESGILECMSRGAEFGAGGLLKATAGVSRVAQSLCRMVLDTATLFAGRHMDDPMSVAAISRDA